MKRRRRVRWGAGVGLGWLAFAAGPFAVWADPPQRVVTLAPSVTEVVAALGAVEQLVGVCGQCDFPAAVRTVPHVGGYLAPSVEAVLAASPDLVIAVPSPANREAVRALERAGRRVLVVHDRTLADLWTSIEAIAAALDRADAGRTLAADVRGRLDAVRAAVGTGPRPRVLLVVGHRPLIVAGGGTLQAELLALAGGVNVAGDVGQAWPSLSLEAVVARAPEVIIDAAMGSESGGHDLFAAFPTVPAVRTHRVVTMNPDALFRAGPRVPEAAAALARAIHEPPAP